MCHRAARKEKKKKKNIEKEKNRDLYDDNKNTDVFIIKVPEVENKKGRALQNH